MKRDKDGEKYVSSPLAYILLWFSLASLFCEGQSVEEARENEWSRVLLGNPRLPNARRMSAKVSFGLTYDMFMCNGPQDARCHTNRILYSSLLYSRTVYSHLFSSPHDCLTPVFSWTKSSGRWRYRRFCKLSFFFAQTIWNFSWMILCIRFVPAVTGKAMLKEQ